MTAIKPFRIAISDDILTDLKSRLARTRWPEAELVDDWSQGAPLEWIREICAYWADGYDWRAREAKLNRFEQFTTEIDGLDIHFLHVRSQEADGAAADHHPWLARLDRRIPEGDRAAGRSRRAWRQSRRCLPRGLPLAAGLWVLGQAEDHRLGRRSHRRDLGELMDRLGYARYGAQGGDWGSAVTTSLGVQDARALRRHPHHARLQRRAEGRGRTDAGREARARRASSITSTRLRLFEAAIDAAADARLRPDRFAERAGGLDPGKILGLDRLQRPSREHLHQGRAARQRHALLGDGDGDLVRAALLGKLRQAPDDAHRQGADGRRCVPQGDHHAGAALDGAELHTTSRIGARWRRAAISPHSSSRSCS